ncbi:PfkB family carbohydrate kinase [Pseudomonadota bacterium]
MNPVSGSFKILHHGRGSIDLFIPNHKFDLTEDSITITQDSIGGIMEIPLEPYASSADKISSTVNLSKATSIFDCREGIGGGVINESREFVENTLRDWKSHVLDLAIPAEICTLPGSTVEDYLTRLNLKPHFLGLYDMPVNIILRRDEGKLIIKSFQRGYSLDSELNEVQSFIEREQFSHTMISSAKDKDLVDLLSKEGEVTAVITKSLDRDYVLDELLGRCEAVIFNYEEFLWVMNDAGRGDENENFQPAIDHLRQLRDNYQGVVYVTLGNNGCLVSDQEGVKQIVLLPDAKGCAQDYINKDPSIVNGVGDAFSAHVLKGQILGMKPDEICLSASLGALFYLGLHNYNDKDFMRRVS